MHLQLRWSSNCQGNATLNFGAVSHLLLFTIPSCAHLSCLVRFSTTEVLVDSQDMIVVKRLEASTLNFVVCKSCCWSSYIHNVSNLFCCLQHAQVSHAKYSLQLVKLQKHLEMGKSSVSKYLIFIRIALFYAVTHNKLRTAFTFLWLKFLLERPH